MNRRKSKQKEKLNIAMFGQKRIPSREGGVEIVVEELCSRMVAQGHNVTCYNRGGHHVSGSEYDSKRLKEYKGIRLKTVPTIEKKGLAAVSSSFFAALCCAFGRYDIVHIHAEGPTFFAWLPKLFGKKVIVTIHGLDWQREKWKSGFGSKFIHQGEKNAVKYADEIIVLSKGVQDYFEKEYGRKTVFIPNGVNRPKIQEAELITEKYGLEAEADGKVIDVNSLVSMNMWGLTPEFLDVLEEGFKEFFEKEVPGNPLKAEYLIPIFIGELLEQGKMSVKVLKTNDTWYGMTYHEDVAAVKDSFKNMLENGVYKMDLFSNL